jgi:hypothetical protein
MSRRASWDDALVGELLDDGGYKVTAHPVAPGKPRTMWVVRNPDSSSMWQVQSVSKPMRTDFYGPKPRQFNGQDAAIRHAIRQRKAYNLSWRRTTRRRATEQGLALRSAA